MSEPAPPRVVYVLTDQANTIEGVLHRGSLSGQVSDLENVSAQKSGPRKSASGAPIMASGDSLPVYDPQQVHTQFPERWRAYIRANYRNLAHIQQVFGVSERTARKWWNGETGANGGHVAIAVHQHPVAAPRMLFAAE